MGTEFEMAFFRVTSVEVVGIVAGGCGSTTGMQLDTESIVLLIFGEVVSMGEGFEA